MADQPNTNRTLTQRRAEAALNAVKDYQKAFSGDGADHRNRRDAYASYVKGVPPAIVMTGLGQTLATLLAAGGKNPEKGQGGKSPDAHLQIYRDLQDWLCGEDADAPFRGTLANAASGQGEALKTLLIRQICTSDQHLYLLAQAEALAYLEWLKKFAVALLADPAKAGEPRGGQ